MRPRTLTMVSQRECEGKALEQLDVTRGSATQETAYQ